MIRSTGFFRAKATSLRGMAKAVVENFGGEIPRTLDDLVTLSGVGRKTANVVLGTVWGIATGVVVDTHVKRITNLLGLTKSSNPEQIEQDLMQIVPQSEWVNFAHRLIHHGRRICIGADRSVRNARCSGVANAWACRLSSDWPLGGGRTCACLPFLGRGRIAQRFIAGERRSFISWVEVPSGTIEQYSRQEDGEPAWRLSHAFVCQLSYYMSCSRRRSGCRPDGALKKHFCEAQPTHG